MEPDEYGKEKVILLDPRTGKMNLDIECDFNGAIWKQLVMNILSVYRWNFKDSQDYGGYEVLSENDVTNTCPGLKRLKNKK